MKILFTGGGSGGHFYPIVAVIEALEEIIREEKIFGVKLYYMSTDPYEARFLFEHDVEFRRVSAGKLRLYPSIQNFFDIFRTVFGLLSAVWQLFVIFPDVVFAKGGYASFPALAASRFLGIPVVIHESDTVPGRVTGWAGKFARRIAVSYPEAASHFPKDRVAHTGNPIRKEVGIRAKAGAHEFLKLETEVPVILILGGSQGARLINDSVLGALPQLVEKYQVIHQTGRANFKEVSGTADVILGDSPFKGRYRPFDYLNTLAMRMASGAADLVVSRAGSTVFEIASWGVPAVMIPITESNGDHQRKNAYAYARSGAAEVIEERNLSPHLLVSEIDRIMGTPELRTKMSAAASAFFKPDAATQIAREILEIALEHEG
jgi:UDP-N-acetylglucosamine--N-acetylmuramyl-(pentapeptide) pyrophosphoryl-undecaprenol N-acetylglucosamine transferase